MAYFHDGFTLKQSILPVSPAGVIIETTGLADPAPVVQTFFVDETISEMYSLDSVITIVDAKNILDRLADEKP